MKKMLLAMSALAALTLLAPNNGIAQAQNQIGVYLTEDADPAESNVNFSGTPGTIAAYVVLTNPYNQDDDSAIATVGGFEFKMILPADVFLLNAALPPLSTNFASPPNFFVGTNLAVTDSRCTLLTLSLGAFSGTEGYIYLSPVDDVASVPGNLAITDFADGFSIAVAYPASGSFDDPVFGLWPTTPVVDTEDASWGEVKSLYR